MAAGSTDAAPLGTKGCTCIDFWKSIYDYFLTRLSTHRPRADLELRTIEQQLEPEVAERVWELPLCSLLEPLLRHLLLERAEWEPLRRPVFHLVDEQQLGWVAPSHRPGLLQRAELEVQAVAQPRAGEPLVFQRQPEHPQARDAQARLLVQWLGAARPERPCTTE